MEMAGRWQGDGMETAGRWQGDDMEMAWRWQGGGKEQGDDAATPNQRGVISSGARMRGVSPSPRA